MVLPENLLGIAGHGHRPYTAEILIAEDDEDDRFLIEQACLESGFSNNLRFVQDGHGVIAHLMDARNGKCDLPGLILLDLNMPRKDGRQVLKEIKSDPVFRKIPVIIFTTSNAREDVAQCYENGANAFITKPVTLERFTDILRNIEAFWFHMAELPLLK